MAQPHVPQHNFIVRKTSNHKTGGRWLSDNRAGDEPPDVCMVRL